MQPVSRPGRPGGRGRPRRRPGCCRWCLQNRRSGCARGRGRRRRSRPSAQTAEPRELVGPDHVDHRHRRLDRDPVVQRRVGGDDVDVPVERSCRTSGAQRASASSSLTMRTASSRSAVSSVAAAAAGADRVQLGGVVRSRRPVYRARPRTRRARPRPSGCRAPRRSSPARPRPQPRLGVMGEDHVDRLHAARVVSCVMTTMTHDRGRPRSPRTRWPPGSRSRVVSAASFGLSGALARGLLDNGWSAGRRGDGPGPARGRRAWCRSGWSPCAAAGGCCAATPAAGASTAWSRSPAASSSTSPPSRTWRSAPALLIEYTAPAAVVVWLWLRHGQRPGRLTLARRRLGGAGSGAGAGPALRAPT